jgi:hypothetical protein
VVSFWIATVANSIIVDRLPTMYTGRPIFRGELGPCQSASVKPRLWVTRPGTYSLGEWSLETEISLQLSDGPGQRTRKRKYLQKAITLRQCMYRRI